MIKTLEKTLDKAVDNFSTILDLFFPGVQNEVMKKKFDNAVRAIEGIKERLAEYGLTIDYEKYFSKKLQIPLTMIRSLSEVEAKEQRDLLQNMFIRHLSEQYSDDSRYVGFIHMIEDLNSLEINILNYVNNLGDKTDIQFPLTEYDYKKFVQVNGNLFNSSWEDVKISLDKLVSFRLIDILHEIEVPLVEENAQIPIDAGDISLGKNVNTTKIPMQKSLRVGTPKLTALGKAFMKACTNPLK